MSQTQIKKLTQNQQKKIDAEFRKNLINSQAPISTNVTHEVRTTLGRFSFVKGSVSPPAGATRGYKYNTDGIVVTSNAGQPFFRKSGS